MCNNKLLLDSYFFDVVYFILLKFTLGTFEKTMAFLGNIFIRFADAFRNTMYMGSSDKSSEKFVNNQNRKSNI